MKKTLYFEILLQFEMWLMCNLLSINLNIKIKLERFSSDRLLALSLMQFVSRLNLKKTAAKKKELFNSHVREG